MNAFVYVYSTMPREWMAREMLTGIAAVAPSRDEALKLWETVWNQRAPFTVRNEAPPRPKRPGERPDVAAAIEGEGEAVKFHRLVLRAFHPDLHGAKKRWSADEIIAAINEAWESTRPQERRS